MYLGICLFAIDECQVISEWGNNFRLSYNKIGHLLRDALPKIPIMALTATSTEHIRKNVIETLKLKNPVVAMTSLNRFY